MSFRLVKERDSESKGQTIYSPNLITWYPKEYTFDIFDT